MLYLPGYNVLIPSTDFMNIQEKSFYKVERYVVVRGRGDFFQGEYPEKGLHVTLREETLLAKSDFDQKRSPPQSI